METRYFFFLIFVTLTYCSIAPSPIPDPQSPYRLALEAILGTGIRLQAFLSDDQTENFIVSPISATVILAQLILGSKGKFQKQLINLIKLPDSGLYENDNFICYDKNNKKNTTYPLPYSTFHLQLANLLNALETKNSPFAKEFLLKENSALFVAAGTKLKQDFYRHLTMFYKSDIQVLDFAKTPAVAQQIINNWASNSTNGRISSILHGPPRPSTAAIFANAIYFLGDWEYPFEESQNRRDSFSVSATKQVNVTYMLGELEKVPYAESEDYLLMALPYKSDELLMYFVLPKEDSKYKYDIKQFVQNIKANEMLETITRAKERGVNIKLPKMSLTHTFSILSQLKKYQAFKENEKTRTRFIPKITNRINDKIDKIEENVQIYNNFTDTSLNDDIYLNNILENDMPLRIDDIIQQVSITVNEKGTEAGAVSSSTIDKNGGSKNFVLDRPFVFFIQHKTTASTLFWGTISNPVA